MSRQPVAVRSLERQPRMTVLMTVLNGERYLHQTMDSILDQTFSDFEFLIINDGSTDGTRDILESYADSRIRVVHQQNMGVSRSSNIGLGLARGCIVARIDSDDTCRPDRLERQLRMFEEEPDVTVVATGYRVNVAGNERDAEIPEFTDETLPPMLLEDNFFMHSTMAYRRDAVLRHGGYDETKRYALDYKLWLILAWKGERFRLIPEPICTLRKHGGSISATRAVEQKECALASQLETLTWIRRHPEAADHVDRGVLRGVLVNLSWHWRRELPTHSREAARLLMCLWPKEVEGYKMYALSYPMLRWLSRRTGGPARNA